MKVSEIIIKKKLGLELSKEEIEFIIKGYVNNSIPDYQVSALLMAICFQGMTKEETAILTNAMMHSGEILDLSAIKGIKVDKHSTGGVGDKTSLVLGPLVASCGIKVAKMSGRGLGHTGGTLDKMEAIPGLSCQKAQADFIKQVSEINLAIIGQTGDLVPADKKLYALRDVTGTVESIPLIASSIMSKKLATGADTILLDVKCGNGAFMKNEQEAEKLALAMCEIGNHLNRDTRAIITDMAQPLGRAIGNILEVEEAVKTLKGEGPKDLLELCLIAGAIMLEQAGAAKDREAGIAMLKEKIDNGAAFKVFKEMVTWQGGDASYLDDFSKFKQPKYQADLISPTEGYVHAITALTLGEIAMKLGAGREKKEDEIDMSAGIILNKKIGDKVKNGDVLATIYTDKEDYRGLLAELLGAYTIANSIAKAPKLIEKYISVNK